jgi:hypothetical protein
MSIDDVPVPARTAILREAGENEIVEVEEVVVQGRALYAAEWIVGDDEVEIVVTPAGEVVSREVEQHSDPEESGSGDS